MSENEQQQQLGPTGITMRQMLEAGVHFGHQTKRWNPKMKPYIFGARNGIYIIDLQKTVALARAALRFVSDVTARGGSVLFVGTKKQAQDSVREYAERCGMPYVNERWLGGMLTNFQTISKRVAKMKEYQRMRDSGEFDAMLKKEALKYSRELAKLERNLGGIQNMSRLPDAVFVLDTKKEDIAVTEANKLGIPIVAVVDTNCDPDVIQYVIPGNDDAIRSGTLMCRIIADAVEEGRLIASKRSGAAARVVRSSDEEDRVAAAQAEARRQAAVAAAEREARIAAGTPVPPIEAPAEETAAADAPNWPSLAIVEAGRGTNIRFGGASPIGRIEAHPAEMLDIGVRPGVARGMRLMALAMGEIAAEMLRHEGGTVPGLGEQLAAPAGDEQIDLGAALAAFRELRGHRAPFVAAALEAVEAREGRGVDALIEPPGQQRTRLRNGRWERLAAQAPAREAAHARLARGEAATGHRFHHRRDLERPVGEHGAH